MMYSTTIKILGIPRPTKSVIYPCLIILVGHRIKESTAKMIDKRSSHVRSQILIISGEGTMELLAEVRNAEERMSRKVQRKMRGERR